MQLTLTLHDHLQRLTALHPQLCPRQILGAQMARLACTLLGVDPALDRKALFVFMEIGRCAADAVMIVTTASPTNGLMCLMDYGKVAATFIHRRTEQAIRIHERRDSRETAIQLMPSALSAWESQRAAYQVMSYEQLFHWQPVRLTMPPPIILDKHAVHCDRCGDRINEHCEVIIEGQILCKPCAFGAYFIPDGMPTNPGAALLPDRPVCSH
ncbi:MAG: FmdE family protein [Aggregatilineales bacterium]